MTATAVAPEERFEALDHFSKLIEVSYKDKLQTCGASSLWYEITF